MYEILKDLIAKNGLCAVINGLAGTVSNIAEDKILPLNGGHRNCIDFKLWERASIRLSDLGDTTHCPNYWVNQH